MIQSLSPSLALLLEPNTRSNRILRIALLVIWVMVLIPAIRTLLSTYPFGVDLEIPLRAAERWSTGGEPYLASAFTAEPGPTQPFLYPPFVLPFMAGLLAVPRGLLAAAWFAICLAGAMLACRRLAIPPRWWPLVLAWPPFAEGIVAGNVQVLLFVAFVMLFFTARGMPFRPVPRDVADDASPAVRDGVLATVIAALKVSQYQSWLFLLRHRPPAALLGAGLLGMVVLATLPITGLAVWGEWLQQLQRAASATNWENGGFSVTRSLPAPLGAAIVVGTLVVLLRVPSHPHAGEWVGILSVIGALSLQVFGLLFLLPAMLVIRRELAILGALFITTYSYAGMWGGIVLVAGSWVGSRRWQSLREPARWISPLDAAGAEVPSGQRTGPAFPT